MASKDWYSVAATALVGVIVLGAVYYSFADTSAQVSSLSSQNSILRQGMITMGSTLQQQMSSLSQQVATLETQTPIIETVTDTVISMTTVVFASDITTTSTVSLYPSPDNVTVLFTKVSGQYSYSIAAGSQFLGGSSDVQQSFPISPVFSGEVITISASMPGFGGCVVGQTATAELFLNGTMVAQGTQVCGGGNIAMTYTL